MEWAPRGERRTERKSSHVCKRHRNRPGTLTAERGSVAAPAGVDRLALPWAHAGPLPRRCRWAWLGLRGTQAWAWRRRAGWEAQPAASLRWALSFLRGRGELTGAGSAWEPGKAVPAPLLSSNSTCPGSPATRGSAAVTPGARFASSSTSPDMEKLCFAFNPAPDSKWAVVSQQAGPQHPWPWPAPVPARPVPCPPAWASSAARLLGAEAGRPQSSFPSRLDG